MASFQGYDLMINDQIPRSTTYDALLEKKAQASKGATKKLVVVSVVCLLFMCCEIIGGYLASSLAIMTDAAHLLSDVSGFAISIFSIWIGTRPASSIMSFGYHRAEVVGALGSVILIWGLTIWLFYEAIKRIITPEDVDGLIMLITAGVGLVCNLVMGKILHSGGHGHSHGGHSHGSHTHGGGHGHSHGPPAKKPKKVHSHQSEEKKENIETVVKMPEGLEHLVAHGDGKDNIETIVDVERKSGHDHKPGHIHEHKHGEKGHNHGSQHSHKHASPTHGSKHEHGPGEADHSHGNELAHKHKHDTHSHGPHDHVHNHDTEHDHDHDEEDHDHDEEGGVHTQEENVNVRAALIHVIGDTVQSVGVILAAIIIYIEPEWKIADPICTFLFSILVLFTTIPVATDCIRVLMEGTPNTVIVKDLLDDLAKVHGVEEVHDLHVWSLSMGKLALSVHLLSDAPLITLKKATTLCNKKYGILHTTIQIETLSDPMNAIKCRNDLH